MTQVTAALMGLAGLSLIFSMGAILGLVIVHHKQNDTYDNDRCPGCVLLKAELARQAQALSELFRFVERVDDRRSEVQSTRMSDDQVSAGH